MTFEQALNAGDLDVARAILDELADLPDTGGLYVPECYADLAQSYDRQGRYDEAIATYERAIEHGWRRIPDARSDIAEFHLRAGRKAEAAAIWAELKAKDPEDVWLYNAAGLSYNEVGDHELAVAWLAEGIELAMRIDDPEGIVSQLSDVRRQSLRALGQDLDELERQVDPFLEQWRSGEQARRERLARRPEPTNFSLQASDPEPTNFSLQASDPEPTNFSLQATDPEPTNFSLQASDPDRERAEIVAALSWFPSGEYERAIERWPSLAEYWADVPHENYCLRLDGNIKWLRRQGMPVRAVAPIVIDDYVAWCAEHDEDPEEARAVYAAHRMRGGAVIPWPPGRNEACWCGSGRKYKKCCGPAPARPMQE